MLVLLLDDQLMIVEARYIVDVLYANWRLSQRDASGC